MKCVKSSKGQYVLTGSQELRDALQALLASYPVTHHARMEIVRFHSQMDQQRRLSVSFHGEGDGVEFVHARHPLMLLARYLERGPLSDTPWCSGVVPSDMLDRPAMLVWAIGSLDGYANRAELLCASVDCATERVSPMPVEGAQKLLQAISAPTDGISNANLDVETLKTLAEQTLLSEFKGLAAMFGERDRMLTEKAKRAVTSYAKRQISRNERQLTKDDLNVSLRNMYLGWNRRIEGETEARLAEIERRGSVRSALEIIGMAVMYPDASLEGAVAS